MEKLQVLVAEDDNDINNMLRDLLENAGFAVEQAFSGTEAVRLMAGGFDLVMLDLMLPGLAGEEVLKRIRETSDTPVIVVSAKDDKSSKVGLLKSGADDYVTKPFDTDELLARIEALLRRKGKTEDEKILRYKNIEINTVTFEASVSGAAVMLTKREFLILQLLMSNPKKVFTKNNIFESVWNEPFLGEDNSINVHISNIRNKLSKAGGEDKYIQTVWGIGFKMD